MTIIVRPQRFTSLVEPGETVAADRPATGGGHSLGGRARGAATQVHRRPIGRIIVRRLLQVPIVLLVVSVALFWLVEIVPGDPARAVLGQYATDQQVALWKQQHGLGAPSFQRYLAWLTGFVRGDWGTSLTYARPVVELIGGWLTNSVLLGTYAFVLLVVAGLACGVWQAFRQGSRADRSLSVAMVSLSATPEFAVGAVLMVVFGVFLHWFPIHSGVDPGDDLGERLRSMTLPAITLAAASVGYVARMVREGTIQTLASAFYRTAVIKGLSRRRIVNAHVLRNSLVPSVAVVGAQLAYLLGGNVVVETLFSYPGMGLAIVDAVTRKDIFVLEAAVMVTATLSILVLLLTDLVNMALDPRIDLSEQDAG